MSYNISSWKTKKIKDLVVPLAMLCPDNQKRPVLIDFDTMMIEITDLCELCSIKGVILPNKQMRVAEIYLRYEGSGSVYNDILVPTLQNSSGFLEAFLVWESGDDIVRLTVNNGEVKHEKIEL